MYEEVRQRLIDAVTDQSPHAGRVVILPLRIDGQWDFRRPTGHGVAGSRIV